MKKNFTPLDESDKFDSHLINIITINNSDDIHSIEDAEANDEELMDFDFDYDPNEMYYAFLNDESIS